VGIYIFTPILVNIYFNAFSISAEIDTKVRELSKILSATKIKRMLQNKNMVAVRDIIKSTNGSVKDVTVKIMALPDAIDSLDNKTSDTEAINVSQQLIVWQSDGYDIDTSRQLIKNRQL
jgi:hypothetical protein